MCDEDWDSVDAKLLCREMGFEDGIAETGSALGVEQNPNSEPTKAFSRFNCEGNEKGLMQCDHQTLNTKCQAMNRASAICYDKHVTDVDMSKFLTVFYITGHNVCIGKIIVAYQPIKNIIKILTLRKHAYSNILKILPPTKENFQIKILIFFKFLLKP